MKVVESGPLRPTITVFLIVDRRPPIEAGASKMPQTLFAQPAGARQPVDPAWAHGRAEALELLPMSTVDGCEASGPLAGSAIWHTKISAPSAAMSSRQGSAGTHRHVYDSCYIASEPADTLY